LPMSYETRNPLLQSQGLSRYNHLIKQMLI
jgi:hypothetical protein